MNAPESITCPTCGRTSFNPNDVRERYCGNCRQWQDQVELAAQLERFAEHAGLELEEWQRWWLAHLPPTDKWHTMYVTTPPRRSMILDALRDRLRSLERNGQVRTYYRDGLVYVDEVLVWRDLQSWDGYEARGLDELGQALPDRDPSPCGWHRRSGYRLPGPAADVEVLPNRPAWWSW